MSATRMNRRQFLITTGTALGGAFLAPLSSLPTFSADEPFTVEIEPSKSASPEGVVQPFNYGGVELLPSRFLDQYQNTRDYFMALPNDSLLKGFRERAHVDAPGEALGGWYSGDHTFRWYSGGHCAPNFGQWLSGYARMARATGDQEARDKALTLAREWALTIGNDGFAGARSLGGYSKLGHYNWDKLFGGLLDIVEYLDDPEPLTHMATIATWASENLVRERRPATPDNITGYSGLPDVGRGEVRDNEWYTLSENLYRAYRFTGETAYRTLAEVWHYTDLWEALAQGVDNFAGKHAYSHVNSLSSAAMAYQVSGDQAYLDTIANGYDMLWNNHIFATGGYGSREVFTQPGTGGLGDALVNVRNWLGYRASAEIPCGSWAVFKLSRYLMNFTGAARYGDWTERMLYNGIGAALPMAEDGRTFYYSDYTMEPYATKEYYPEPWPCCAGTFPLCTADYHNLIYFRDAEGLYVNLFVPSRVTWDQVDTSISLTQTTSYPEQGSTRLNLRMNQPTEFALRFRIPAWVKSAVTVSVNGQTAAVDVPPGNWARIKRTWTDNDAIEIRFPLDMAFMPVDANHPAWSALMVGPTVLVSDRGSHINGDQRDPQAWVEATDAPLSYAVRGDPANGIFRPYYVIEEGAPYWMYLDFGS